jgi:hypothetical protein
MLELDEAVHGWLDLARDIDAKRRDPFSRFALVWIGLNTYYSFLAGHRHVMTSQLGVDQPPTDRRDLLALAGRLDCIEGHKALLGARDGRYLEAVSGFARKERQADGAWGTGLHKRPDDLKGILTAVYRVRCNLFHGLKSPSDVTDRRLVEDATIIMESLLTCVLPRPARRAAS